MNQSQKAIAGGSGEAFSQGTIVLVLMGPLMQALIQPQYLNSRETHVWKYVCIYIYIYHPSQLCVCYSLTQVLYSDYRQIYGNTAVPCFLERKRGIFDDSGGPGSIRD